MRKKLSEGNRKRYIIGIVIIAVFIASMILFSYKKEDTGGRLEIGSSERGAVGSVNNVFDNGEIKTTSDGTKYIVDPKKIRGGAT
jgi:hypothetical protein